MPLPRRAAQTLFCVALLGVSALPAVGQSGAWQSAGSLGFDLRWFDDEPAFPEQEDGVHGSVTLEPELRWRSAERRHQFDLALFARWDENDSERSHVDLREGSYRYVGDSFELLAGMSRVFWGVAESRHLVDTINQVDAVEDIDEEDRLGQPMVRLAWRGGWGRLELFSLLGFRERTFPGADGRLRPPLPIDNDRAFYESDAAEDHVDWALRWSHSVGSWDVGVSYFSGTDREPVFVPASDLQSLVPLYRLIDQLSLDVQSTRGAWLLKLEALAREGHGETFAAAVAGFERTVFQLGGTSADLGLLAELLWDERGPAAPPTIYDDDTFLGLRLALNDIQDSQLLLGAIVDNDDHSTVAVLEASRRFGTRLVLSLEARRFEDVDPLGDLAFVAGDSFVTLRAAWHW